MAFPGISPIYLYQVSRREVHSAEVGALQLGRRQQSLPGHLTWWASRWEGGQHDPQARR